MNAVITHIDREQMERLFEVKWADFMEQMGTPHYRPSVELKDMAINLALHATKLEREAQIEIWSKIVESEREACAKVAEGSIGAKRREIAAAIRARGGK